MNRTILVLLVAGVAVGALPVASVATHSQSAAPHAHQPNAHESLAQENATEYPPGLSADGVTDPLTLADAHRDALSNVSYTITTTATYRHVNGSLLGQTTTTSRVAAGGSSFSAMTSQTEPNATGALGVVHSEIAVWANETSAVTARQIRGGDATYRQVARERAPFEPSANWELFYSALGATNTTVVETFERDGETLFRVVSTGQPGRASAYPEHGSYSFTAVVDSDGVVRTFQQTFRTTFDDRPAVVSRTMHVTQIGNTTVERPDWYGQAVDNESATTTG